MIHQNVQERAVSFTKEITDVIQELELPVISTMTTVVYLDHEIDLINLKNKMKDPNIKNFISQVYGDEECLTLKTKGAHFNNSLVFKTKSSKTKSSKTKSNTKKNTKKDILSQAIKVFCNGSLHITGYKCLQDSLDAADVFSTLIELVEGGSGLSDMYNVIDFNIQLINLYYVIPQINNNIQVINLDIFHELLSKYSEYYTSYNNDHYAGILLKSPSFTLMIFESGNVIISSVTTAKGIKNAYEYISKFVCESYNSFIIDKQNIPIKSQRSTKKDTSYQDYGDFFILK